MKKALTSGTRILEVADADFPVHASLQWVEVPDDTTTRDTFVSGAVVKESVAPLPDVVGFNNTLKAAMGGIVASNALAKQYPLFLEAVRQRAWDDVRDLLVNAKATSVITADQYISFQNAATAHHIPLTLP